MWEYGVSDYRCCDDWTFNQLLLTAPLPSQVASSVLPEHKTLLSGCMRTLDAAIHPGTSKLQWVTAPHQVEQFFKAATKYEGEMRGEEWDGGNGMGEMKGGEMRGECMHLPRACVLVNHVA